MAIERFRLRVSGTVQGVGFRPFVHRLARGLGLTGGIGNDDAGVWCEIQGQPNDLLKFQEALHADAPPLAHVERIEVVRLDVIEDEADFKIVESVAGAGSVAMTMPPDVAPCASCLDEVDDPADRRSGYAFTCCTDCGPRYTVVSDLPYDRERTSMAGFALCAACRGEYSTPGDRRHHAQATCCPRCGPALTLRSFSGRPVTGDLIAAAASLLDAGGILAMKGVGGFQLLCRADDDDAVTRLRLRKHRDEKPFALMTRSMDRARSIVLLDEISERALASPQSPIVLAPRRPSAPVAPSVAPDSRLLGVMLPASPLHHLLARAVASDLVCTSGNLSDRPIVIDDTEAHDELGDIADALLSHNRRIVRHADDSVGQSTLGRFQLLRRARGFAPRPVKLRQRGPAVLGVGAALKNTVCLAVDDDAHVSVHLGDLESLDTLHAFENAIADLISMARTGPELVVHDLHPEYLSTKFATAQTLGPTLGVQHHHAHLVSCLVDNAHSGPAIGVTFDGAGWGTDSTLWGGEFLVGDETDFERLGHLDTVALPGGDAAVREPWRMAVAHLVAAFDDDRVELPMVDRHRDTWDEVVELCADRRTIATSSIGRLFDAVAALCDLADRVSYEGQAAILLEQVAIDSDRGYRWSIDDSSRVITFDPSSVVRSVVEDRRAQVPIEVIAGAFHRSIAELIADVAVRLRERTGINDLALSGGVFQNRRLIETVVPLLDRHGFATMRHIQVPPNDGGISLGQVAVGRAHLATH